MQPASKLWSAYAARARNGLVITLCVAGLIVPGAASGASPLSTGGPSEVVRLVAANDQGAQMEFTAPAFAFAVPAAGVVPPGGGCMQAQAAGFLQSEEFGRPQLPMKVALLGVPPGAEPKLEITAGSKHVVRHGVTLCTSQSVLSEDENNGVTADDAASVFDPAVYGVDAFYPAEPVRLVDLGFMRSQRVVRVEFFPLQYNPVTGEVRANDLVSADIRFGGSSSALAGGEAVSEPAEFEDAFQRSLLNYEVARSLRSTPVTYAAAPLDAWTPPQPGYKVTVKEEGLYQLTHGALSAAGLPVDQLDPRTLRMFNASQEVAIRVLGEEDGKLNAEDVVLFYGQGADTRYTDTNVYWLTYGGTAGLRMTARASSANGATISSFFHSVKREDNTVYDSDLPMEPGYDHWFGQQIQAVGANKTGTLNLTIQTPALAPGTHNATVSLMLGAVTAGSHHVKVYVNPATSPDPVWNGTWDGQTTHLISANFAQNQLVAGANNTVRIELINDFTGRAADIVRLDWLRVGYQRSLLAGNDRLLFGGDTPGASRYRVDGFTGLDVELYDVTDAGRVTRITDGTVGSGTLKVYLPLLKKEALSAVAAAEAPAAAPRTAPAATYSLRFGDNQATPRRYLAQRTAQRFVPLAITLDSASNLQAVAPGADYIIITHGSFASALQPLAAHRAAQGMRVRIVDVQDVYDEFGGGLMSAEAIRDFVEYAYNNWTKPAPHSVLLVGDGTYDFRNYRNATPTFVPPYLDMVDPGAGETATDNRFVAVTRSGGGYDILPDLNIGRLPANSGAEASAMVGKIVGYETQAAADWQKRVLFVADDLEGGGGNFYEYSDKIADGSTMYKGSQVKILPTSRTASKVYLGQTCDKSNPATSVECRAQIIEQINAGALMVSYIGHGVTTYWAAEHLYDATSLASINNTTGRLPIMLPMTCNEGYFIDPAESSLSELGVRAENRGAVASWSATGYGLAPGHDYLQQGLFLSVFQDNATLGAGATSAKLFLVANAPAGQYLDLIDTFLLLGDPGLQVP